MNKTELRLRWLEDRLLPQVPPPPQSDEGYIEDIENAVETANEMFFSLQPKDATLTEEKKREILERRRKLEKCDTWEEAWRVHFCCSLIEMSCICAY